MNYTLLFFVLLLPFLLESMRHELMFFQQNSYKADRYLRSIKSMNLPRYALRWVLVILSFVLSAHFASIAILCAGIFAYGVWLGRKKYKKPLVNTPRVKRLWIMALSLVLLVLVVAWVSGLELYLVLFPLAALMPLLILLSNGLLFPIEKSINRYYYNDAKRILKAHRGLTIIGITGSYGKTSTKHYLERMLSEKYNVLMTPGNFNTTLGVIITIRQHLKPYHNVFIVEMGAKQVGDIKEICELVNPSIGILTSVGEQHLETFGSIQNVQRTKFELIDSLPIDGLAVLNADYEYIRNRENSHCSVRKIETYAMQDAAYEMINIRFDSVGKSVFDIIYKNELQDIFATSLLGAYNLSNLLACYIVAKQLGCSSKELYNAIKDLHPVEHRLSVKRTPNGVTILDDAYNSNPQGAQMALEVLGGYPGNRKIVITPGMIELGVKQEEYNERLGRQIAKHTDYAFLVGQYNRAALLKGLESENYPKDRIYACANLDEAVQRMNQVVSAGDVVLYENDLPDTFK